MTFEEEESVSGVFRMFTGAEMVGYRALRCQRKRSSRWTDEIKEAIERKRRAYMKIIQRNVGEEIRVRRTEYK